MKMRNGQKVAKRVSKIWKRAVKKGVVAWETPLLSTERDHLAELVTSYNEVAGVTKAHVFLEGITHFLVITDNVKVIKLSKVKNPKKD